MSGTVTDGSGALIPGADVTLTQLNTNESRKTKTEADGSFRADFLPIGPYSISVTVPGFTTLTRTGITLTVTEEARVDLTLKAGSTGEIVEVNSDIPLVNIGNSTLGRTVDNVEIDNLPLVDRNVYQLLDLTPGVQNNNNNGTLINPLGSPEQHVKINGSSDSAIGQVSYYLDGVLNMNGLRNTGNPLPNPDAIQEFAVQTNNFSAQFGRSGAGVVTVITKSGTNHFHGSAFEFYRTRGLTATNYAQVTKVPYNQHRFGATIGGPIKQNKAFFFGSYAGYRFITAATLVSQVPSQAMRDGNFSENMRTDTTNVNYNKCVDSSNRNVAPQNSMKFLVCNPRTHLPYAGNQVPVTDFDPTVLRVLRAGLIPLPTGIQLPTDTVYTRRDYQRTAQHIDEYLAKGDYQINPAQRIGFSYFHNQGDYQQNPSSNNVLGWNLLHFTFFQHNAGIHHIWTINPHTTNEFNVGYLRYFGGRDASPQETLGAYGSAITPQSVGGGICPPTGAVGCSRSQVAVSGWFTGGNVITGPKAGANVYLIRDVLTTTKGRHTLSLGGEINDERDAQQTNLNNYGIFTFSQVAVTSAASSPQYTGAVAPYLPIRSQAAITDFFFGTPATLNQDTPDYANAHYRNFGVFLQDDWRAGHGLTVNLGIRYDVQTTPIDSQKRTVNFIAGRQSTIAPTAPLGMLFPGDQGVADGGTPTEFTHVSPRVGLAYSPYANNRTVFHAAAGLFFGTISGNAWELPSNSAPFTIRQQYNKVISVADPYHDDPSEFCPSGSGCAYGTSPFPFIYDPKNPKVPSPSNLYAIDPNYKWPRIYQFNFGVQQQFTSKLALTINYVGALGRNLPLLNDANYPTYNVTTCTDTTKTCGYANSTANVNNRRSVNQSLPGNARAPQYGSVYVIRATEGYSYHGMQLAVEQRVTHGLTVRGFYVWSRDMQSEPLDNGGALGDGATTTPEDANLKYLDRERSDYDQRHVALITAVYKPEFGVRRMWEREVVNGWTITTIIRMQSGRPINVTTGQDTNFDGQNNDRPNLAGIGQPKLTDSHGSRNAAAANWIDRSYFCVFSAATPTACPGVGPGGSDGTFHANDLNGPGYRVIDASLFKDFQMYQAVKVQLRAEATNVFNMSNLGTPNTSLSAGALFGRIQSSNGNNRILQVGARVLF